MITAWFLRHAHTCTLTDIKNFRFYSKLSLDVSTIKMIYSSSVLGYIANLHILKVVDWRKSKYIIQTRFYSLGQYLRTSCVIVSSSLIIDYPHGNSMCCISIAFLLSILGGKLIIIFFHIKKYTSNNSIINFHLIILKIYLVRNLRLERL